MYGVDGFAQENSYLVVILFKIKFKNNFKKKETKISIYFRLMLLDGMFNCKETFISS